MKKFLLSITFLLTLTAIALAQPSVLYFDFEGTTQPAFNPGGAGYNGVNVNPSSDGVNASDSVGMSTTGGNSWDGIVYKFDTPLDLSTDTIFTMLVYHPTLTGQTRMQFDGSGMSSKKIDVDYTTPGAWQKLEFKVPRAYHNKITSVMLVFAHDRSASGEQWYFDEVMGPKTMPELGKNLLFDFEGTDNKPVFSPGGAVNDGVAGNPMKDATNASDSVGMSTTGSNSWDGIIYKFDNPINLTADTIFTMLVYHPTLTGQARLQFDGTEMSSLKIDVDYTTPGAWQLLQFKVPRSYDNKITSAMLVFAHDRSASGEQWYFDDFRAPDQYVPLTSPEVLYFDFEGAVGTHPTFYPANAQYNGVIENPAKDAVNSSDSVGMTTSGSATYYGIVYKFDHTLDLSAGDGTFSMMVYHPTKASTKIRIQVQGPTLNVSTEGKLDMPYTTPGQWQKITWTISKELYDNKVTAVLFNINEGAALEGEQWYFDEFKGPDQYPPLPPHMYFDFEGEASTNPSFVDYGTTYGGVQLNPFKSGVNVSDSVGVTTTGSATYNGFKYTFDQPLDLSAGDGIFTLMVYHPTKSSSKIRIQVQGETLNPGTEGKLDMPYTTPGEWQRITWTVSKELYDKKVTAVLFSINEGTALAGEKWYFDKFRGPEQYVERTGPEPLSYYNTENRRVNFSGFSGAGYDGIVANPAPDATDSVVTAGKAHTGSVGYAGISMDLASTIDFSDTKKFTMNVLSDSIGYVRIQLEQASVSEKMKLSVLYDTPGQWKELTFDPAKDNIGSPLMDDTWSRVTLVFDDKDSDNGEVWYFDNLRGPVINLTEPVRDYVNFETLTPSKINNAWGGAVFGGVVENPNMSGINLTDSAGLFYTGTITYGGIYWNLPGTIDFSNGTEFTMMVYSDSIGRARIQLEHAGNTSTQCKIFAEYTTPGQWQKLTFDALNGGKLPLRDNHYNRMLIVFDNTDTDPGEEWYFDQINGPDIYHSYYADGKFEATITNATPTTVQIDINNSGNMIDLVDDGTNGDAAAADGIWTATVPDLPVGDHVYDFYVDNAIASNGNDVDFTIPESWATVTIPIDYSVLTSVERNLKGDISIYPNPVKDRLTIENPNKIVSLKVYNINGSEIINKIPANGNRVILSTSQLKPGVFIIRIMDENSNLSIRKFIKK